MLAYIKEHANIIFKAILGLSVAALLAYGVIMHKQNQSLQESLEMAKNDIAAYEGIVMQCNDRNYTLKLTAEDLARANDRLVQQLDSVAEANKIKPKNLNVAATQTQTIDVNDSKGVRGDEQLSTILTKYKTYSDSIQYNDLTKVYYTIGEDTVSVALNVQNTQYLYTYKEKQWKNKKNFFKRLLTLDFKKVWNYRYEIINTNKLLNTSDVRVIEVTE